jgi:sugar lactone lactonase YvrE
VYWTDKDAGTVNQRSAAGGAITVLASSELNPRGIAVDATHVYWVSFANPGHVARVPIGGGTVELVQSKAYWAEHIALDTAHVYWADQGATNGPVYQTAKSGGAITALAPSERSPFDLATDGLDLYWTSYSKTGGIRAAPASGGAARDVVTSLASPTAVAFYGSDMFIAVNGADTIVRVPKTGGTPTILAASQPNPQHIAVDASGVYWTNQTDESVRMLAPGSTTPVILATNSSNVRFITTDATAVYWTTATSVMRLVK